MRSVCYDYDGGSGGSGNEIGDRYHVLYNYCNCHPETCCCYPYKLIDTTTGKKLTTGHEGNLIILRDKLNKKNQ
jgi:hypothetical protein